MTADVKAAEFAAQLRDHSFVKNAKSAATLLGRAPGSTMTIAELRTLLNQTAASASVLDMTGMTVTIDDQLTLQDHPGIMGGTFVVGSSTQRAGLLIRTTANRAESQVTFILGSTFLVHAQHSSQAAVIYALDGRHVLIDECKILGVKVGRAIYVRGTTANAAAFSPRYLNPVGNTTAALALNALKGVQALPASGCGAVHVLRTQIHMNSQDGEAITFEATRSFAPQSNARDAWRARNATAAVTAPVSHCIVAECDISGGHYGVAAYGARLIWVGGCRFYRQVRGTSAQDTTLMLHTYGCDVIDPKSTGHHNAYGAAMCIYLNSEVDTGRSNGEGLLQAYVGCGLTIFRDCKIKAHSETKSLYAVYSGVGSSVSALNGSVTGVYPDQFTRGVAVAESDWIDTTKSPQSRTFGGTGGELDKFLNAAKNTSLAFTMTGVPRVKGSYAIIRPTSPKYSGARVAMEISSNDYYNLQVYSDSKNGISIDGRRPGGSSAPLPTPDPLPV